ncbi:MAG TPA: cytidylate kinase family protein [Candidatus Eisenbergiella stercoravium]|nr:cytidylate kinase family protein [Candidatus Eisenbergiella stercoravium]
MEQTQTNDFLEKESLGRLMVKYAVPCVISLLVAALYNIVDQIFIANASYLGSYGNAANTVVFPLTVVALSIAMMIGDGCCTFVSISLGARENDNAHRGIGSSVIAVVAAGVVLTAVFLIFQDPILTAFGARVNEETFRLSKEYFFWITLGIPFYMFGQAMNSIIRSDGSPKFAMVTLLTGAILNVIFDPVCIFVCKWGMMGAAVATIFGQEEYAQIPTAVVGIVMKFFQIVISISVGLAAGCIPVAGYNVGAQRSDRVKGLMRMLLMTEFIVGLIASAIFLLFPHQFVNIFGGKNESVYYTDFAVKTIRIFLCLLPLSCLNKGTFIFLQSLGKAKESTALSMMREIVFGVGLPLLLPIFMGLDGVLFFMPIADVLTAVASVIVILYTWKTLNQMTGTAGEENVSLRQEAAGEALTDTVITIGRSYGAGGRTIGKKVAEQLHIPYYDSEILEKVAESSGLSRKFLQSVDEKPVECSMLYRSVGFTTSAYEKIADQAAQAQREIIEKVAAEGPCVIIGRSADQVLAGKHKLFRVFISSSRENRVRRIMEREGLTREKAEKKVARADRERAAYYNQRSNVRWGDAAGYDLCLDADWFHVDGACRMIAACVMQHSQKTN